MADQFPYRIQGDDLQMVEVRLDPGDEIIGEAGAMMYIDEGITFDVKVGQTGSSRGGIFGTLVNAGTRMLAGEGIFVTHFTNSSRKEQVVAFASEAPGKIIPLLMSDHGGELIAQKDAFLCGANDTTVSIAFQRSLGRGLFGGEGFILQKLQGQGQVFLSAGGMIIERELKGETIRADSGAIVAFESQIDYDIERAGSIKSMMFGGEGLFLATLSGHGKVWLQSLPISRLAGIILSRMPTTQ